MSTQVGPTLQAFTWSEMAWDCPGAALQEWSIMRMAPACQETSPLYSRESWVAILYQPVRFEMEKVTNST